MEWRCLENDWQKLYLTSLLRVRSHPLSATDIIGLEAEECNCSEQRWDAVYDISADRGVTNYRQLPVYNDSIRWNCVCDHNLLIGESRYRTDCYAH